MIYIYKYIDLRLYNQQLILKTSFVVTQEQLSPPDQNLQLANLNYTSLLYQTQHLQQLENSIFFQQYFHLPSNVAYNPVINGPLQLSGC